MRRNRERDAEATRLAEMAGWTVVRLWECRVLADPVEAARHVLAASEVQGTRSP